MNFQVKPLNDIKRILLSETIKLLQHHGKLPEDYQISLQPGDKIFPNEDIFTAIRKLDSPRNAQVEFLWRALDELERISTIGFNNEKLVPHYRERCFTGIAIAVVDQIYNSYRYRSPDKNSVFYEGLQRAVGLLPEAAEKAEKEQNTLDLASKATLIGCAFRFLMPYLFEDALLQFIHEYGEDEVNPFADIPEQYLGELFKTIIDLNQKTYTEVYKSAKQNTLERAGQKALHAKQKEKAEQGPSKGYFGMRIFGNSAPPTSTNNPSEATNLPPTKADEHQKSATLTNP
ncbi:Uncharacterised protein [Legionella beliardensis]|uniref:Dot/Icm T4SS effector n=1 Tax=Legionella beliardensis TaxID=91822 RepID=A0A378I433_9GAMM|nr:hypothetical protein [Legionella beliardensis]STX29612.1 Uncharacterised protein [Legionella beliardensis]